MSNLQLEYEKLSAEQKAEICFKKAAKLHSENNLDEALRYYAQCIALNPKFPDVYNNMAVALRKKGHFQAALASYERSITLRADHAGTYSNMGNVLNDLDRIEESLKAHQKAISLEPDSLLYLYNTGLVLRDLGRLDEAISVFDKVLDIDPEFQDCPWDRSLTHLMNGSYKVGFEQYESRWRLKKSPPRTFKQPRWDGSELEGKTLFIHREQGFGDAIQFLRFIKPIKEKYGAKIILECKADLINLFKRCRDLDGLVPYGNPFDQFDFWIPMMSLPRFLEINSDQIPGPYPSLSAPETSRFSLRPALEGGLNVGIVWAGSPTHQNDRRRSAPLEHFLPLISRKNLTVFSLQKGDRSGDIQSCGAQGLITDAGKEFKDFDDTASLINQLDLIISVDTAVVHLASGLGKKVWLMLPYTPDWRWLMERSDSPWYPDMKIFRQSKPGDWESAFDQMFMALDQELAQD